MNTSSTSNTYMVIIGKYNYYIRSFPTEINENNETDILKEDKTQKISFLS